MPGIITPVLLAFLLPRAFAADPTPSAPPRVAPVSKVTPFGCKREYLYQGDTFSVDSIHRQDGEGLRPLLTPVPQALQELEAYQQNRRSFQQAAYVGTAGIGMILLGSLAKNLASSPTGDTLQQVGLWSGVAMILGGLTYSFVILSNNEAHLGLAVRNFNAERPNQPIELQFETGIKF